MFSESPSHNYKADETQVALVLSQLSHNQTRKGQLRTELRQKVAVRQRRAKRCENMTKNQTNETQKPQKEHPAAVKRRHRKGSSTSSVSLAWEPRDGLEPVL